MSDGLSTKQISLQGCLPTFLGIGSMRCGSTWLYEVLKCHPDIRLSAAKEMDFFFMRQMLHHDLRWYEAHFAAEDGNEAKPFRGEISPLYARLKAWQVHRIATLLPNLRIIFTLRHPIERAWSQAVYEFGYWGRKDVRKINSLQFLLQVQRARNILSSDYGRTISIWTRAFGREALHIDFFDKLQNDPESYINGVLKHIGVSNSWPLPTKFFRQKVFATHTLVKHEREIPELVQWYLADQLLKPTVRLNNLMEGAVSHWVDEMRAIRGGVRSSWRILRELNRTILSFPERFAYDGYHAVLDIRLWLRWQKLRRSHVAKTQ